MSKIDLVQYQVTVIPVSKIDTADQTCLLTLNIAPEALIDSIKAVGLLNPPLVRKTSTGNYGIVCGFRRVKACQALGWHDMEVRLLSDGLSKRKLLEIAIWDNRSHRPLNVVEQVRGVQKLTPFIRENEALDVLSSLLGFPANAKVFQKIQALGRLPRAILLGLLKGNISFEAAVDLCQVPAEAALSLFDLLNTLKLSQNKEKEVITLIREIAVIEETVVVEVVRSSGIETVLKEPKLNRNEKGARIRAHLKSRRFPTLAEAQETFRKRVQSLKLNEHMKLTAPPYFEGRSYTLQMDFTGLKELRERCRNLEALFNNPVAEKLFDPHG